MRTHIYSQKLDFHLPKGQCLIGPVINQALGWPQIWLNVKVFITDGELTSQECRSSSEELSITDFFPFLYFDKCKAFACWCEELESFEFIWTLDSLPNCTQSKTKLRGQPTFLWSGVLVLSCPLGQYPAWSQQQEMTQSSSLGGRYGLWARQKQEKNTNRKPTGAVQTVSPSAWKASVQAQR